MEMLDYQYLADLVIRAQADDSNAFAELYAATYQQQYRYAYKYLRDEQLAQDAMQETFVQALRNIKRLKNPELFIAWLNRINFRTCLDMKKARHEDKYDEYSDSHLETLKAEDGRTEDEVVTEDSRDYIMKQIMRLPITESQVIVMKYYQEMTNDDIAEAMNISRSTVKRYLKSGRERLSRLLPEFREWQAGGP